MGLYFSVYVNRVRRVSSIHQIISCLPRELCSRSRLPASTFEEVDLLPAVVSWSRQSESGVQVIGNVVEAHVDFSRVVGVQHAVVEPPVFASLWGTFGSAGVLVMQLLPLSAFLTLKMYVFPWQL